MSGARPKDRSSETGRAQSRSSSGNQDGTEVDKQMITHIIRLLCRNGGKAKVSDLERHQQQQQPPSFIEVMSRRPQQFTLSSLEDGDILAKVRTDLKLCAKYCTKAGCDSTTCDALHICKYFLISSCAAEKKQTECDYGHDLRTDHNLSLLEKHGLRGLRTHRLQLIFKLNRCKATLPMTCTFYNKIAGCTNGSCQRLHICLPFLQKQCKFGEECRRSHNLLDIQPQNILIMYGFNVQTSPDVIRKELQEQMQNCSFWRDRHTPLSQAATAFSSRSLKPQKIDATPGLAATQDAMDDGEPNICMFFLRGKCSFGNRCRNKHLKRHFQWQLKQSITWVDFEVKENRELELNFSDPNKQECFLGDPMSPLKVDLVNMVLYEDRGPAIKVRRLGTISSVLASAKHKGTTRWLWFWRNDAQKWIEYGDSDTNKGSKAGITSTYLEEVFDQNKSSKVQFVTLEFKYELDFATMTQVNLVLGTRRPVRRRPVFDEETKYTKQSSLKNARSLIKGKTSSEKGGSHKSNEATPSHWKFDPVSDIDDFKAVPVLKSGKTFREYRNIEKLFGDTMPAENIKCIRRIQNLDLWQRFERKKIKMRRKLNSCDILDERLLFHGTRTRFKDGICQQGFDWRYSGTATGALLGDGSYFARDANYSSLYTDDSTIFVARVLVGQFAQGSPGERLPPVKATGERYDSSVNNSSDPSIFVIYHDDQSYPEYLIEY